MTLRLLAPGSPKKSDMSYLSQWPNGFNLNVLSSMYCCLVVGYFGDPQLETKSNRPAAAKDPKYWDILAVIQRTCVASDRFWRTIYQNGLWIPKTVAIQIVSDGWSFTVSCSIQSILLVSSSVFYSTPWKYVWDPPFLS